jgi:pSer/pThr/pTyr-binding forkhead associated (FHA) protein
LPEQPSIEVSIGSAAAAPAPIRPGYEAGFRLTVVHRDGSDGTSYSLLGDQIDLGHSEGDLLFDDPHLAPRHARISVSQGGRVLSPLETRNGVYVRIRAASELADGDHFLLGKQVMRFEAVPEIERNLRPAVEHGVALFGTPTRPAWCRLRQVTAAGVSRDVYYVSRGEVVIGREQADIVFSDDEFMSRRHAQLSLRGGRPRIEDLGSSNGTFLRLRRAHNLSAGDLIRIGDELLRFEPG